MIRREHQHGRLATPNILDLLHLFAGDARVPAARPIDLQEGLGLDVLGAEAGQRDRQFVDGLPHEIDVAFLQRAVLARRILDEHDLDVEALFGGDRAWLRAQAARAYDERHVTGPLRQRHPNRPILRRHGFAQAERARGARHAARRNGRGRGVGSSRLGQRLQRRGGLAAGLQNAPVRSVGRHARADQDARDQQLGENRQLLHRRLCEDLQP